MSQTAIGIFDYTSEAQEAVNYLVNNGFSRSEVDLSSRASETEGAQTAADDDDDDHDNSIGGFFSNLFGTDDDDADKFTKVGRKGSIVTVHAKTSQEAENAAQILDNFGAIDVDERAEQYRTTGTTQPLANAAATDADSIKIIEERMQVGKREVETGGVRLRSRIVEKPVQEEIRLRTERVRVARTDVNRKATEADLANFKDATVELTETAEVPVVSKEAYVTGEVSLEKDVEETNKTVQGTVRKTEVDTENLTGDATDLSSGAATRTSGTLGTEDKDSFYK